MASTKLNNHSLKKVVEQEYPYIYIKRLDEDFVFALSSIPDGDLPLCITDKGALVRIRKISRDPLHLQYLIKHYTPLLVKSKEERFEVSTVEQYIESGW